MQIAPSYFYQTGTWGADIGIGALILSKFAEFAGQHIAATRIMHKNASENAISRRKNSKNFLGRLSLLPRPHFL